MTVSPLSRYDFIRFLRLGTKMSKYTASIEKRHRNARKHSRMSVRGMMAGMSSALLLFWLFSYNDGRMAAR